MPVGFNTLSAKSFFESKRLYNILDDKISNVYRETLLELGVGINELNCAPEKVTMEAKLKDDLGADSIDAVQIIMDWKMLCFKNR